MGRPRLAAALLLVLIMSFSGPVSAVFADGCPTGPAEGAGAGGDGGPFTVPGTSAGKEDPTSVAGTSSTPGPGMAPGDDDDGDTTFTLMPYDDLFRQYMDYEAVSTDLQQMAAAYPHIAKLYDISAWTGKGSTWGGRSVWAMKISDDPGFDDPDEPDVLIVGNHHAREWMSLMVPMYLIHYLLENYGAEAVDNDGDGSHSEDPLDGEDNDGDGLIDEDWEEAEVTWLVNTREFWIVPMLNPDGTEVDMGMSAPGGSGGSWRKNIRDNNLNGAFDTRWDGVDLNRNYPYHWEEPMDREGSPADSALPTSDVYRGPQDNHDDDGDSIVPPALQRLDIHDSKRQDWIDDHIDEDPWDGVDNDGDGLIDEDRDGGFSEPETLAMEALMRRLDTDGDHHNFRSEVPVSISYHSYSALVMWPWGYTHEQAPNGPLMASMGRAMADIMGYTAQPAAQLYLASGDWGDWMYGSHGSLAFTIELNTASEGGFKPATPYIINTSRLALGASLYLAGNADVAQYAKVVGAGDLNVPLPNITHSPRGGVVSALDRYRVEAAVDNAHLLGSDAPVLHYSSDDGASFRTKTMDHRGEGVYSAEIPPQPDGAKVRYFITAAFSYTDGDRTRVLTVSAPRFAPGETYTYDVDALLAIEPEQLAALVLGMAFFFTITWGGFGRTVHMAIHADRRKMGLV